MPKKYVPSEIGKSEEGYCFIRVSSGDLVIFDEEDAGKVAGYHWYAHKRGRGLYAYAHDPHNHKIHVHMHRLVLPDAPFDIDHINGNGLDNRKCNLRSATRSQNIANTPTRSDNKLGLRGVCYHKATGKYMAQITKLGEHFYLGVFETKELADAAYKKACMEHFGEFSFSSRDGNISPE